MIMVLPMIRRNMKQMIRPFLILFAVLAMYYGVIIYMYDPKLMQTLKDYQELMPELMAAVGMTGASNTLTEFINTYLYGFLMLLFPLVYLVILGNQYLMNYVETGSLACILSTGNSRKKVIISQAVSFLFATVLLVICVALFGGCVAEVMFPGELDWEKYLQLNTGTLLLQIMISGLVFLSACVWDESRYFYVTACGIPLLSYLFSMIGNMGDTMKGFSYLSIYTLFPNDKIMEGNTDYYKFYIIMAGFAGVMYVVGANIFCKKDLKI